MLQSQYDPGYAAFGGGSAGSVLHPVVIVAMAVVVPLILVLSRRHIIVPLLLAILLTPYGQNVNIGVHFPVNRILIIIAAVRVLMSGPPGGKHLSGGFIVLDKLFLVWASYRACSVVLLYGQTGAVINQVAFLIDALVGYFVFRSLIRDEQDVHRVVVVFAIVAFICGLGMIREQLTRENIFGLLGGMIREPAVRNGRIRASAAFAISIAAGTFGAITFPLFLWLWKRGNAGISAIAGALSSIVMIVACASSTPIMAWAGGIIGVCFWPIRNRMRTVRWACLLVIVALQVVMKAPFWFVLAHVDAVGGSSGWERAELVDNFLRHFWDWWLIGTHDNVNWGWDMWDQCNQYVTEGETGGAIALGCFIWIIVICFKMIGKARKAVAGDGRREWQFWLLGVTMWSQILGFIGIDYFDQSKFVWYLLLAVIAASTMSIRVSSDKPELRFAYSELAPATLG